MLHEARMVGGSIDTEFVVRGTFDDGTAPEGYPYIFEGVDSIMKIIEGSVFR